MLRKLSRDTRRYIPAALIPAAASLAAVSIFTRIFDSADFGRYSLAIATVAILSVLLSGWIQQSILRYLPRFKAEGRLQEFTAKTKGLLAVVGLVVAVAILITYFAAGSHVGSYRALYLPALALLLTEVFFLNLGAAYQADQRAGRYAASRIAASILRLGLALALVLAVERSIEWLLVGSALGQLVVVIFMWRSVGNKGVSFDSSFMRTFAAYGLPLIGWALGGQILGLSDRFVIAAFRNEAEVGIYSANYGLFSMGFGLVTGPLLMAAHPLIIGAWERGEAEAIPPAMTSFSRIYLLLALPVVAVPSALSREFAALFLGADFREGHRIVPFVLSGAAVWGLSMYGHKGLELMERTRVMFAMIVVAALVNLGLNFAFVPRYGYGAAAVATLVAYSIYVVLVYAASRRTMTWRVPWLAAARGVGAALVAAGVSGALARLTGGWLHPALVLVCGGTLGLAAYVAMLVAFREITWRGLLGRSGGVSL